MLQRMIVNAMLANQQRTQELEDQLQQERTINAVQRALAQVSQQGAAGSISNQDDDNMPDMGSLMQMANAMMGGGGGGGFGSRDLGAAGQASQPQSTSVRLPAGFTDNNGNGVRGGGMSPGPQSRAFTPSGSFTPQGGAFSAGSFPGPPPPTSTPAPLTAPCCQASTTVPPVVSSSSEPQSKAVIGYIVRPNIIGFRPGPFDGLGLNSFSGIGGLPVPLSIPALAG